MTKSDTNYALTEYFQLRKNSLHFNDHFPDGSGLAGTRTFPFWILVEQRMMEVVSTGVTKRAKLQSNRHHQQTKTQVFRCRMPFLSPN